MERKETVGNWSIGVIQIWCRLFEGVAKFRIKFTQIPSRSRNNCKSNDTGFCDLLTLYFFSMHLSSINNDQKKRVLTNLVPNLWGGCHIWERNRLEGRFIFIFYSVLMINTVFSSCLKSTCAHVNSSLDPSTNSMRGLRIFYCVCIQLGKPNLNDNLSTSLQRHPSELAKSIMLAKENIWCVNYNTTQFRSKLIRFHLSSRLSPWSLK